MPHERSLPVFPLNVPIYTVWQDVMGGFPVVVEETAVMSMSLPVVVEMGPQVGCESDLLLPEREVVVDIADIRRDIGNLPDVFPVILVTRDE